MKIFIMAAVLVIICSTMAQAEDLNAFKKYDVGWNVTSYARQGSKNTYGGDLSFTDYVSKRLGIVADLAEHRVTIGGVKSTTSTYRFGPRFVIRRGSRMTTFAEVLAGGTRISGTASFVSGGTTAAVSSSQNGYALAIGGGVDIAIRPWVAVRAPHVDFSYLRIAGANSNGVRIAGGFVFRFGQ